MKGDTREGLVLKCGGKQFGDEDQCVGGAREGVIFLGRGRLVGRLGMDMACDLGASGGISIKVAVGLFWSHPLIIFCYPSHVSHQFGRALATHCEGKRNWLA